MTTPNPVIFTGDDLVIKCPVTFDKGALFTNLTGAVVTVRASTGGPPLDADSVAVAGNEVTAIFDKDRFTAATWSFQVRATKAGRSKTVATFAIDVQLTL